jgi:hypothetical protein
MRRLYHSSSRRLHLAHMKLVRDQHRLNPRVKPHEGAKMLVDRMAVEAWMASAGGVMHGCEHRLGTGTSSTAPDVDVYNALATATGLMDRALVEIDRLLMYTHMLCRRHRLFPLHSWPRELVESHREAEVEWVWARDRDPNARYMWHNGYDGVRIAPVDIVRC